MVGLPCPCRVPALLPATPGGRASQPTPPGRPRQAVARCHHGCSLGLTGRWKGPQGARGLAEHRGGHRPRGGCSLGDTPGRAHTGEVQDGASALGGCRPGRAPGSCARGPGAVGLSARALPLVPRHGELLLPIWDVGSAGWVAQAWDFPSCWHNRAALGSHPRSVFLRHRVRFAARDVPFVKLNLQLYFIFKRVCF